MSAGAITLADITTANWSLALDVWKGGASGAGIGSVVEDIADIEQCFYIILSTPLGSDPLRPTFGLDSALYVDVPQPQLATSFVGAAKRALETWEPRATINKLEVVPDGTNIGHITVTIYWQLAANPNKQFTTKVTI